MLSPKVLTKVQATQYSDWKLLTSRRGLALVECPWQSRGGVVSLSYCSHADVSGPGMQPISIGTDLEYSRPSTRNLNFINAY